MHRFARSVFAVAPTLVATVFLAGCGGGGSGSSPVPAPTTVAVAIGSASPSPLACFAPTTSNATTVSVQSIPSTLGVTIATGTTSRTATTPTSVTPLACDFATLISIAPSNGAPAYTFGIDQHNAGSKTFLYNQAADTNGSIGTISTMSVARSLSVSRETAMQTSLAAASLPRRFSHGALGRPLQSATRLVVRYRALALRADRSIASIERAQGVVRATNVGPQAGDILTRVVDVPAGRTIVDFAASMRAQPEVLDAAPERLYYTETSTAVKPNDTHYSNYNQWSMFVTGAPNAWGYTTGSSSVAIAIIDTGADFTHQDLLGKITYSESILSGVVNSGTNPATGMNYAQDTDGHGTNVSGIAAADTNNNFGYAGMGFNTSLQVYKVFSNGTAPNYSTTANSGDVTQAIYDAVAHGARAINLSLGTCQVEGVDPMQQAAVAYAIAHGVTVVAAAGNERSGSSTDPNCTGGSSTVDFPAAYDGVVAVGASKYDDSVVPRTFSPLNHEAVASYSNAGPGLTLVAPGGDPTAADQTATVPDLLHWIAGLYTTTAADPSAQCSNKADCQALFAGTSQATPHVSGTVALMLALNPGLSPAQIKTILADTADDLNDPYQGAGRLDAYRALAVVAGDPSQPQLPTNINFVAFAYVPNGTPVPAVVDVTYPTGVRVSSTGTFRIADIPSSAPAYKIGVWYDANGDGKVDAGDYFGTSSPCMATVTCASASGIIVHPVTAGFVLN